VGYQLHPRVMAVCAREWCEMLSLSLEGEKDPRCLLVAFDVWCALSQPLSSQTERNASLSFPSSSKLNDKRIYPPVLN
jgi:hypothetical protein